ncbi:MAG: hypothetical protein V1736_10265 [Pseudomonadota bacterium]
MKTGPFCISLFFIVLLFGCAPPATIRTESVPLPAFLAKYRRDAIEYEKNGNLYRALINWHILAKYGFDPEEDWDKIGDLQEDAREEAVRHFSRGLDLWKQNKKEASRKEFLLALLYNPGHEDALNYIRNKLREPDYTLYKTEEGDTLRQIAEDQYKDPDKDFVVAYFNDLDKQETLKPGQVLRLPIIDYQAAPSPRGLEDTLFKPKPWKYR